MLFSDVAISRDPDAAPTSAIWGRLSSDDRAEFLRLRSELHQAQQLLGATSRVVSFTKELHIVLKFIERSESHREERSVLTGIAFGGPFICVNTRLLKAFLGRCKSSINGGFQQLGYVAVKTKAKARTCILALMRSLNGDISLLRQWSVRAASRTAELCFVSSFPVSHLPQVNQSDLKLDGEANAGFICPLPIPMPRPMPMPIPMPVPMLMAMPVPRPVVVPAPIVVPKPVVVPMPVVVPIVEPPDFQRFATFGQGEWAGAGRDYLEEFGDMRSFSLGGAVPQAVDLERDWMKITNEWASL
jgi:hypothetical protein